MSKHYKYGGSTANRTINCPSWTGLAENMPPGAPSSAALEGTMMHGMFELAMLDDEYNPEDYVGNTKVIDGIKVTVTEKHADKVYTAIDTQLDIEEFLDLNKCFFESIMECNEHVGGTADIVGWSTNNNIFVVGDLKTGDGLMVWATENQQLMFYAWLAVLEYAKDFAFNKDTVIRLYIIQPSERRDDPLDYWDTDLKTIMAFGKDFVKAVKEAETNPGEPCAGEWCSYCPAMATCPAKTGMVAASARIPANSTELKDLLAALNMVDDVEAWCKSVRKIAHEQLEEGVVLKGFKLVPKRAMRVWTNEEEIELIFKNARKLKAEDYYNQKLKSPAQMEAACKKKGVDFKKYASSIVLHSSGTTLVKDSDPRQASLPLKGLVAMAASIKK